MSHVKRPRSGIVSDEEIQLNVTTKPSSTEVRSTKLGESNQHHFYKKIKCVKYVKQEVCKSCKKPKASHETQNSECKNFVLLLERCKICKEKEDNSKHTSKFKNDSKINIDDPEQYDHLLNECTIEDGPTDSYGNIKFSNSKIARYIRIAKSTEEDKFIQFLYENWKLERPELILSITGAAQNINIVEKLRSSFKVALIKAAKKTNAWIISGGTNYGVMRLVGEAMKEDLYPEIPIIGIATWGVLGLRDKLKTRYDIKEIGPYVCEYNLNEIKEYEIALNPDHTHFILVDDGSYEEFGADIDFRTRLEQKVKNSDTQEPNNANNNKRQIPMVLIVVEGGPNTIKTVCNALEKNTPVILVKGTGGCSDTLIEAIECKDNLKNVKKLKDEEIHNELRKKYSKLENLLKLPDLENYINIYDINKCEGNNIEPLIIEALLKIPKEDRSAFDTLKLAVKWNQFEKVNKILQRAKLPKNNKDRLEFDFSKELPKLLKIALIEDRADIVELIIGYDANINTFLTIEMLEKLYNNQLDNNVKRYTEPFLCYLYEEKKINDKNNSRVQFKFVKDYLLKNFNTQFPKKAGTTKEDHVSSFLPQSSDNKTENVKEPEFNLFIWALLSNRIQIAKIFWKTGMNQISNALMATKILKHLALHNHDSKADLEKAAKDFEQLAVSVLDTYDKSTRDIINDVLILRYIPMFNMDVLQLAVYCDCKEFISMQIVQNVIEDIWKAIKYDNDNLKNKELDLVESQRQNNNDERYNMRHISLHEKAKVTGFRHNLTFFTKPRVRYTLNLIYNIIFLIAFSFNLLFLNCDGSNLCSEQNSTKIEIREENSTKYMNIGVMDILLLLWIIGLTIEEIRQCFWNKIGTKRNKLKDYLKNEWNLLDFFGLCLFYLGFIFKFASSWNGEAIIVLSRIILSVDLILWYLRSLHFLLIFENVGPKLHMIRRMFDDLTYLLLVIFNFALAFGIALQVLMDPYSPFSFKAIFDVVDISYWPIYGQVDIVEKMRKCIEDADCDTLMGYVAAYIILMVYMVFSGALLLNLVIAVFNSIIERTQNDSGKIWKTQRYGLVCEYISYPIWPPLLFFIEYLLKLIKIQNQYKSQQQENESNLNPQKDKIDYIAEFEKNCTNKFIRESRNHE